MRYLLLLLILYTSSSFSQTVRLAILHGDTQVFSYEISVLKLALEQAPGQHELVIIKKNTGENQERILKQLADGNADFDVFFTGMSAQREKDFLQIDFPISRGLLGHRIFITHKDFAKNFRNILTKNQLIKELSVGSGFGWPDTEIFKSAGFNVIVNNYETLWRMTDKKRFIGFNRGIHEAFIELENRKEALNNIIIDQQVMVVYPFDYMFYTTRKRPDLHALINSGLKIAFENGSFMQNFYSHPNIKKMLKRANIEQRKIFHIDNPLLTERTKSISAHYWHKF